MAGLFEADETNHETNKTIIPRPKSWAAPHPGWVRNPAALATLLAMSTPFDTHLPLAQTRWARLLAFLLFLALVSCLGACTTAPEAKPPVKLALGQVDRGVVIWLPDNVLFDFGSHTLSPQADVHLREIARLAMDKTQAQLSLEGHTDNVGSEAFNQALSARRAEAVAAALKRLGVPEARLNTLGLGLSQPIAPNDSDIGRRLNRRVEIVVLNETVAHLTEGEPANRFEDAFARLKAELGERIEAQGFR